MNRDEPARSATSATSEPAKTPRGEETRARIVSAALQLFRSRGFEKTTMRGIAEAAGVSLGNAYYYFRCKEDLIQGFYDRMFQAHRRACEDVFQKHTRFSDRLQGVMRARQETAQEYHAFAAVLFRTAADPNSPLNPFSEASQPVREKSIAIFRELVSGSKEKFPKDLQEALPELLWLLQMAMVLYWIHDTSNECCKSIRLVERSVALTRRFLTLIKLAPMKPLRTLILKTYREFRDD